MIYRKVLLLSCFILAVLSNLASSQGHEDWSYNLNIYEVNTRQYTASGTFSGFATHLDRLKELGVGIIWFMPIHPIGVQNRLGSLGSPYSVRDYLAVNPEFGTLDEFKALVDTIHAKGMYVIIDWVGNHTSWDNVLTVTHPEWYVTDGSGNFVPPPGTNWSDVIQLDHSQQGLRDYMIQAMTFWINEAGIDGFRCDAVSFMPGDFWSEAITALKAVKPGILMLAEDDSPQYQFLGFDMSYAWGLHGFGNGVLKRIYNGTSNVGELGNYLNNEVNTYGTNHYRMYFTSNHDENSWHGTVFEQFGAAAEIFAVLTGTINSMQLIYGGQEAGLNKRLLFFDKDQIIWQPHPFANIYRTLLYLKRENRALWNGSRGGLPQRVSTTNTQKIFAFVREKEADKIFAVFNLGSGFNGVTLLDTLYYGTYRDVFSGDTVTFNQSTNVTMPGWTYHIYEKITAVSGLPGEAGRAGTFVLAQNYPNPFNPETVIGYQLSVASEVKLTIYNIQGEEVRALHHRREAPGLHTVRWDGRDDAGRTVSSGVYIYRLETAQQTAARKMILLR